MPKNILVTGATGKQGGALINNILDSPSAEDFGIYAVTRDANSKSAVQLSEKPTVRVIKGNLDEAQALFTTANAPIWGVFCVTVPMGSGQTPQSEERQGKALIDAALLHGNVEHFVFTSVDRGGEKSSTNPTSVPHFTSKHHAEQYLKEKTQGTNMKYTILRPVAFMENITNDFVGKGISTMWKVSLATKPLQLVATEDIGYFAAQAFMNPSSKTYANAAISLAGDELSWAQADAIFNSYTGKSMPMTFATLARTMLWGVKDLGLMFKWFAAEGYGADIAQLKQVHPGLMKFDTWLQQKSAWRR